MIAARQFVGIEVHADRVFLELRAAHEVVHRLRVVVVVDLEFDFAAVGVAVVHRGSNAVIDGDDGRDAGGLEAFVGDDQIAQAAVGVSEMIESGGMRRTLGDAGEGGDRMR